MNKWNLKKALVVFKEESAQPKHHRTHSASLKKVCATLEKNKISYRVIRREKLKTKIKEHFVITVGGDGTFLHASHFSDSKQLLLGVNSVPHASHGAFCSTDAHGFERKLKKLLLHQASITSLVRLQAKINGKKISFLALNDILFANPSPAGTSRYEIKAKGIKEIQKSSGVWISTPSGSSAAIHSAGGKVLPKHSRQFQFLVREPFLQGKEKIKMIRGILSSSASIQLRPHMSRGALFIDGAHIHYPLKYGDKVEIGLSNEKIWAVMR